MESSAGVLNPSNIPKSPVFGNFGSQVVITGHTAFPALAWLDLILGDLAATENCSGGDGHPNQSARDETDRWLNSGDQL